MAKKPYVNEYAPAKSSALLKAMLSASVSPQALQRKSQLPMQTVEKALKAADMSNAIYDGLLKAVEEIKHADSGRTSSR